MPNNADNQKTPPQIKSDDEMFAGRDGNTIAFSKKNPSSKVQPQSDHAVTPDGSGDTVGGSSTPANGDDESTDNLDDPKKKKKPEDEPGERPGSDGSDADLIDSDPDDELLYSRGAKSSQALIKQRQQRKLALRRAVKRGDIPDKEFTDKLEDAVKSLEALVNDQSRFSDTVNNGSAKRLGQLIKPLTSACFMVMNSIKTSGYQTTELKEQSRAILNDINLTIATITNAQSETDMISAILSARTLYINLMSTNNMIKGEPNLVNSDLLSGQTDLWKYFHYDEEDDADIERAAAVTNNHIGSVVKARDKAGDNAVEPDSTIIKPIFLLFVDDHLLRKLEEIGVSEKMRNLLGNFSIPSVLNGNSTSDLTPEEEDLTPAALGRITDGEVHHAFPNFSWSKNGVPNLRMKTISAYRSINDAFLKELVDFHAKAQAAKLTELTWDICFAMTLTNWLNAAFKVLVESNFNISKMVMKGYAFDEERLIPASNGYMAFKLLDSIAIAGDSIKSIFSMPASAANDVMARSMSKKMTYSEVAYKRLQAMYVASTFKMPSSCDLYIGDTLVGKHTIKITVVPKLYLPVDLMTDTSQLNLPISIARSMNVPEPIIRDPFSFCVPILKARYQFSRNLNEMACLFNQSLLHMIVRMPKADYETAIQGFYDNTFITTDDNRDVPLSVFFGTVVTGTHESSLGYPRRLSAIAPFYNKAAILGIVEVEGGDSTNEHQYLIPFIDQYFQKKLYENNDYQLINHYHCFSLGNYIKAIFNQHADWSWIEAGIVASLIYRGFVTDYLDTIPSNEPDNVTYYGQLTFAQNPSSGDWVEMATVMRRASIILDDPQLNFTVTRFKSFFEESNVESSSMISKDDIFRANRFVPYNRTHFYVVDNAFARPIGDKKVWPSVVDGKVSKLRYLIKEDEYTNITADAMKKELVSSDMLKESFLFYDNVNATKLNLTPELIAGTDLIGYAMPSTAARDLIVKDKVTPRACRELHFNDYCYLVNDVYPTKIIYTIPMGTDTLRALSGAHFAFNNSKEHHMSNIKFFDVVINALHRAGADSGNRQGFRVLVQACFGLQPKSSLIKVIRDSDAMITDHTHDITNGFGSQDYKTLCSLSSDEALSLVSSYRYPGVFVGDATGELTGMPEFLDANELQVASLGKARSYYSALDSIIPNERTDYQTYQRGDVQAKSDLFDVRQYINDSVPNPSEADLVITLPAREIISVLELEDK